MHSPDFSTHGFLRVAAATPVVSIADPMANAEAILIELQDLAQQHVAIAVFPELCLSGYSAEDLLFTENLLGDCRKALALLVKRSDLPLCAVGIPWRLADGRLLNCAALIGNGKVLGWCLNPCSRIMVSFTISGGSYQAMGSTKQRLLLTLAAFRYAAINYLT